MGCFTLTYGRLPMTLAAVINVESILSNGSDLHGYVNVFGGAKPARPNL
jgi:hypothetical protein